MAVFFNNSKGLFTKRNTFIVLSLLLIFLSLISGLMFIQSQRKQIVKSRAEGACPDPAEYPQCGATPNSCENVPSGFGEDQAVLVRCTEDEEGNIHYNCEGQGKLPGECGNPEETPSPPPDNDQCTSGTCPVESSKPICERSTNQCRTCRAGDNCGGNYRCDTNSGRCILSSGRESPSPRAPTSPPPRGGNGTVACSDNPENIPIYGGFDTAGYKWVGMCGNPCSDWYNHSDCPKNTGDGFVNPDTSRWCFNFKEGGRCMQLQSRERILGRVYKDGTLQTNYTVKQEGGNTARWQTNAGGVYYELMTSVGRNQVSNNIQNITVTITPDAGYQCRWELTHPEESVAKSEGSGCSVNIRVIHGKDAFRNHLSFYLAREFTSNAAPTNLRAQCAQNGTQATLTWDSPASKFDLRVNGPANYSAQANNCTPHSVCINGYSSKSIAITAQPNQNITFWVHAQNSAGQQGPISETKSFSCSSSSPSPITSPSTRPSPSPSLTSCDFNEDGIYDDKDFRIWSDEFTGNRLTLRADCNGDGRVDLADFNKWRNEKIGSRD